MIVTKENQRLYPTTWVYNASRIMTQLAEIVINHGGKVKPCKNAVISNRTLSAAKHEYQKKIERYTELNKTSSNPHRDKAIKAYRVKLDMLSTIKDEPITVTHTTSITFVLDNTIYYYQVDDNPFFPCYYSKTPVKGNQYSQDACMEEDKREWLFDCFFECGCSDADIREGANLIFNMLVTAENTPIRRESVKRRVPDTYGDGWHYENVPVPERIGKIDF